MAEKVTKKGIECAVDILPLPEPNGLKFYVSPILAEKIHENNIPYRGEMVINQPMPTTSNLSSFIPGIWAQQIVDMLVRQQQAYIDSLTPEELEDTRRWIKRRRHYERKIAWTKAHRRKGHGRRRSSR